MYENVCVFEDPLYSNLYPLSLTRPVFDLRCGILTLREKIEQRFPAEKISLVCREELAPLVQEENPQVRVNAPLVGSCLFVNGRLLANGSCPELFGSSEVRLFVTKGTLVAAFVDEVRACTAIQKKTLSLEAFDGINQDEVDVTLVDYPWDLVNNNPTEIASDFRLLNPDTAKCAVAVEHAAFVNDEDIHLGQETSLRPGVVLDASGGPIWIGDQVTIMANAVVEGPAFIGDCSQIKIGAKIYKGTSIGEVCKVGGELEESIVHSHSNKQHDGFLGHAYLGQWVNLGADTNNSDLKNNYGSVKVYVGGQMIDSGSQFAGLFMGDHAKSGINSMFNTGTVVGAMSNVFGAGFPPKFVPSFAWGGAEKLVAHDLTKALATARRVMARRQIEMSPNYEAVMRHLFKGTQAERDRIIQNKANS